jgi:hypothetical protein
LSGKDGRRVQAVGLHNRCNSRPVAPGELCDGVSCPYNIHLPESRRAAACRRSCRQGRDRRRDGRGCRGHTYGRWCPVWLFAWLRRGDSGLGSSAGRCSRVGRSLTRKRRVGRYSGAARRLCGLGGRTRDTRVLDAFLQSQNATAENAAYQNADHAQPDGDSADQIGSVLFPWDQRTPSHTRSLGGPGVVSAQRVWSSETFRPHPGCSRAR